MLLTILCLHQEVFRANKLDGYAPNIYPFGYSLSDSNCSCFSGNSIKNLTEFLLFLRRLLILLKHTLIYFSSCTESTTIFAEVIIYPYRVLFLK